MWVSALNHRPQATRADESQKTVLHGNDVVEEHIVVAPKAATRTEVAEEVDYEDDFEEASEDEAYVALTPEIPAQVSRLKLERQAPSPQKTNVNLRTETIMDLKYAMEKEQRIAEQRAEMSPQLTEPHTRPVKISFSAMKLQEVPIELQHARRSDDLRRLGVIDRFSVSNRILFHQRPQKSIELFLNACGKYRGVKSISSQCGEDNADECIQTDKAITQSMSTQCPVYSLSKGGEANLYLFCAA